MTIIEGYVSAMKFSLYYIGAFAVLAFFAAIGEVLVDTGNASKHDDGQPQLSHQSDWVAEPRTPKRIPIRIRENTPSFTSSSSQAVKNTRTREHDGPSTPDAKETTSTGISTMKSHYVLKEPQTSMSIQIPPQDSRKAVYELRTPKLTQPSSPDSGYAADLDCVGGSPILLEETRTENGKQLSDT
jgi:hypothetical protein